MVLLERDEHPFLGREIAQPQRYSESSAKAVDDAVHNLILEAENRALAIIQHHRKQLTKLVAVLEQKETLYKDEITQCLESDIKSAESLSTKIK